MLSGFWRIVGELCVPRRSKAGAMSASFTLLMSAAAAMLAQDAYAQCTPVAGPGFPAAGTVVNCSGTTTDQNSPNGFGDGSQTGLTLNVHAGATVTGTAFGIDIKDTNSIFNSGSVAGTSGGITAGAFLSVTNNTGATVTSNGAGNAIAAIDATVTNNGTISATSAGSAARGVNVNTFVNVTNNAGAIITSDGIAIAGTDITLTNFGTVAATGTSSALRAAGTVSIQNNNGGNISGILAGIQVLGSGTSSINNLAGATISGIGANSAGLADGSAAVNAGLVTVTNGGTISGTRTGIQATSLFLTNTGMITGPVRGILTFSTAGGSSITNAGTIGGAGGSNSTTEAIQFSFNDPANTIPTNPNTLTLASSSIIHGLVLGAGADIFQLGGTTPGSFDVNQIGSTQQYRGFALFNKVNSSAWTLVNSGSSSVATQNWSISGGTLIGDTNSIQGPTINNNAALVFNQNFDGTFSGRISGNGSLEKQGSGILTLTGTSTYGGGTAITAGTVGLSNIAGLGSGDITMNGGALRSTVTGSFTNNLIFHDNTSSVVSAAAGQTLTFGPNGGASFVTFGENSTARFGSPTDTGTVVISSDFNDVFATAQIVVAGGTLRDDSGTLGNAASFIASTTVNAGATLDMNDKADFIHNLMGAGTVVTGTSAATTLFLLNGDNINGTFSSHLFSGVVKGPGSVEIAPVSPAGGETILTGTNLYTGGTFIQDTSILRLGNGGATGSILGDVTFRSLGVNGADPALLIFDRSNTYQFGGAISGPGNVTQAGSGNTVLTALNTYTGITTVNGGTLSVNGSIASSSMTTVNAGGTLAGNGTVGNTTINGGTLSPGNSIGLLTVRGSLMFTAASSYMVEVSPSSADRTNVTATATLGGATINASFAPGTYVAKQYTILNATGGVNGTFGLLVNTNLPAGFSSSLSYDAHDAFLNLTLSFSRPSNSGLSQNQQNVATAIVGFFNANGGIPLVFGGLKPAGLTQVAGETATGSQQATFDAMNLFMGLMTDPFMAGRGDPVTSSTGAPQFAEESEGARAHGVKQPPRSGSERDAYAAIYREAPAMVDTFAQRWSVWAAGYGGSQTTDGNAALGSNTTTSRVVGTAVAADYRFSPFTMAGFALTGGGTNFGINGLGTGRSDLFQAGAFIRHTVGPAYISAALAYGWQDFTTDRTVAIIGVDRLRATFSANAFSGRVEGGYRFVSPLMGVGITPYAAGQFTTFLLPTYAEQVLSGANTFALGYAAKDVTVPRSELGIRGEKSFAMQDSILTLRGRAAWAHNFNTERSNEATFQTLPGASFVVNGAAPSREAALITSSAELKWLNGFSLAATFEGEFSSSTQSYAGKGVARYAW